MAVMLDSKEYDLFPSYSYFFHFSIRNKGHQRSEAVDDKRSSAAHTLLRENSRVDRV